jgi:2-phosphosulfolactate phosphatase
VSGHHEPLDQRAFDLRCEWGEAGLQRLAPSSDVVIIVDVFSFSTSVEIGVTRGAQIYPYRWHDETARHYAEEVGAELAGARGQARFSLSPGTFMQAQAGNRIVLPSRNGATLSLLTDGVPTLLGCLRNASAVAAAARRFGPRIAVIPAGERWPDGSLRPALEDWLGAGAILSRLEGHRSSEASAAVVIHEAMSPRLLEVVRRSSSGQELIGIGYPQDIDVAAEVDVSEGVPVLEDGAFTRLA